tara:strand:- start:111 stop:800 length:690 start_codon:yes stop_codon:yes gene_type:complete
MNYLEFVPHYKRIKAKGFVKTERKGDGAAGNAFEDELGLKENNKAAPDIEGNELKVQVKGSSGKQTLFNKEGEWIIKQIDFLKRYGWEHSNHKGELTGQSTITKTPNKRGFYYESDDDYLYVKKNDVIIVRWDWCKLVEVFGNKFPNCIKVLADGKKIKGINYFHYNEAYLFKGTTKEKFRQLIEDDVISIDFRLYTQYNKGKSIRNRGTAFRIDHEDMDKLFVKTELE